LSFVGFRVSFIPDMSNGSCEVHVEGENEKKDSSIQIHSMLK
jgi:hypothetical protein